MEPQTTQTATDSEQQVLGSILFRPELIDRIAAVVRPDDFIDDINRQAFVELLKLHQIGDPIGPAQLKHRMIDHMPDPAGYIGGLAIATAAHWKYHAERITRASQRRRLVGLSVDVATWMRDGTTTVQAVCDLIASAVDLQRDIEAADPTARESLKTAAEVMADFIADLEQGVGETIPTGIDDLDYALSGGLCLGEMAILAGRPSHGKTMVVLQVLDQLCQSGHECLLLSEEMSFGMLAKRLANRITSVGQDQWNQQIDTIKEDIDTWQDGRANLHIAAPCGNIKKAIQVIDGAARRGIKIIALDYAQLLRGGGNGKYEQASDVSQRLREAASRHGILLLCLCQLSRRSEEHEGKPRMSDIRDSGQFEQDADVILFCDWPALRGADAQGDEYYLRIRKNRNRETLTQDVKLRVDRRRQTVASVNHEWAPEAKGYDQFR